MARIASKISFRAFSCGASLPVQADPLRRTSSLHAFSPALLPCRMISDSPYIHTPNLWIIVYHIFQKMSSLRHFCSFTGKAELFAVNAVAAFLTGTEPQFCS